MDFGKLDSNDRRAVYGSVCLIVGVIVGGTATYVGLVAVLAALGMLLVVFITRLAPSTALPGTRGSLMILCGGLAAAVMALAGLLAIAWLGTVFSPVPGVFFLLAIVGGFVMGWAGWRAFEQEGGRFQVGRGPRPPGP